MYNAQKLVESSTQRTLLRRLISGLVVCFANALPQLVTSLRHVSIADNAWHLLLMAVHRREQPTGNPDARRGHLSDLTSPSKHQVKKGTTYLGNRRLLPFSLHTVHFHLTAFNRHNRPRSVAHLLLPGALCLSVVEHWPCSYMPQPC